MADPERVAWGKHWSKINKRKPAPRYNDPDRKEWEIENRKKRLEGLRRRAEERKAKRFAEGRKKAAQTIRENNAYKKTVLPWVKDMSDKTFEEQLRENHKEMLKLLRTVSIPANVTTPTTEDIESQKTAMKQLMYIDKLMTVIGKFGKIVSKVEQSSDEYEDIGQIIDEDVIAQGREYLKLVQGGKKK